MKNIIFLLVGLIVPIDFCVTLQVDEFCQVNHERYHMRHEGRFMPPKLIPPLFLMPAKDSDHRNMNENLIKWGHKLGFKFGSVQVSENCIADSSFNDLALTEALNKHYNVINLKVHIPFNNNFYAYDEDAMDTQEDRLALVGHTYVEEKIQDVCKTTTKKIIINGTQYETCEPTENMDKVLYGKLISTNIKSYKFQNNYYYHDEFYTTLAYDLLDEILTNINPTYDAEKQDNWKKYFEAKRYNLKRHNIVICENSASLNNDVDYDTGIINYNRPVIIKDCDNINYFTKYDALAVLTPKPLKEETVHLPVIFFDDMNPYLSPKDKVIYPYSTTLYGNFLDEMAQKLLEFLLKQSWKRVAIVSDDSDYSQDFEELMTNLFKRYGMVYSVHQCWGSKFNKAMNWLKEADARIIIANVNENNIKKLVHTAKRRELTAKESVLWIFLGWPLNDIGDHAVKELKELLYVTLSPETSKLSFHNKIYYQMFKSLTYIKEVVYTQMTPEEREDFFKNDLRNRSSLLMNAIEELQKHPAIYVRNLSFQSSNMNDEVVFDSTGSRNTKKVYYKDQNCDYRGTRFESLCQDFYPVFIMMVMVFFLLGVLCIVMFFRKISPRGRNYRTF